MSERGRESREREREGGRERVEREIHREQREIRVKKQTLKE